MNITSTTQRISSTSSTPNPSKSQTESQSSSSPASPLTTLITSRTTSTYTGYNGCRSKLEFGTMIDLSREIAIYCSRMCDMRCETIISDMHNDNENYKLDPNYIACTQTCPQLCLCN